MPRSHTFMTEDTAEAERIRIYGVSQRQKQYADIFNGLGT